MKKFWNELKLILAAFLLWRGSLFIVAFFATLLLPRFGARFPYVNTVLEPTKLPSWIWSFGNFDGVHYLRIAQNGYRDAFYQAFFPLYPLLIRFFNFLPKNVSLDTRIFVDPSFFYTALAISNFCFLVGLIFFYKLLLLDFNKKIALLSVLVLLAFPTAFYFGSIYSESLFFSLLTLSLYLARKGRFFLASVAAGFASATRIIGLLLLPVLLIEVFQKYKDEGWNLNLLRNSIVGFLLAPLGFVAYLVYLKLNFDQPLLFLTAQPGFGAERSAGQLVFLPQVIYRYFKMFMITPFKSLPFFNLASEFIFALLPLFLAIIFYNKVRASYLFFILGALVFPTLTGTFSSMPRYSLMAFLLIPYYLIQNKKKGWLAVVVLLFFILQIVFLSLFSRGYWVSLKIESPMLT